MYKILTIVGTRPEIIKMSRVIEKLDKHFNHILVHTGQNYTYELNKIFFKDLEIRKPDYFFNIKSKTPEENISQIILKSSKIIKKIKPDALLIYGDTNSCLSAISAKRNKVPIFHMEAGNRCFDQRVPEEINRKIIDHISDINLVLSEHARRNLLNEGLNPEKIFKTGSHLYEVYKNYENKIENSTILKKLKLQKNKYFIVSSHREENVDSKENLFSIFKLMSLISLKYQNYKIIFSAHPRTQDKIAKFKFKNKNKNLVFIKPFNFTDYCNLQKNSFCTISDSGTIFEESSILNFPAITIRCAHERQEGIDSGSVILSDVNDKQIINKIKIATQNCNFENKTEDYFNTNVSSNIVKIVSGYIEYINSKTWYKNTLV